MAQKSNNQGISTALARKTGISGRDIVRFLGKYGIIIALVLMVVTLSIISPVFLRFENIFNILRQISINGYLAIGMTFVVLTGGIDLSVGSIAAISGIMAASVARNHQYPVILAVVVGLGVGLLFGFINGFIVARFEVAPFIVTLGMMSVARGMTFIYSDGRPIPGLKPAFNDIAGSYIFGVPTPVIILAVVVIIAGVVLYKTKFGRYVFAIGGNEKASMISGLNVRRVKMAVYSVSGLLAGLAGVILASRVTAGLPQSGQSYELDAIAAVVIGGTSLSGGKGKLWGTIVGFLLIGVMNNGLDLMNVSSYYQQVVKGLIIILAILLDKAVNKD